MPKLIIELDSKGLVTYVGKAILIYGTTVGALSPYMICN